jgi:hypothetical protein
MGIMWGGAIGMVLGLIASIAIRPQRNGCGRVRREPTRLPGRPQRESEQR